jgi:4-hydroxybenzoate polyprenyltransferase
MTWRIAIAFALLLCAGGFGLAATINNVAIVDAVNAKLPSHAQFDNWGLSFTKTQRLHREYRRLYPEGRLLWREGTLGGLMFLCVLVAALFMGLGFIVIVWPGSFLALMLWFTYFRKQPTHNGDAELN